MMLELQGCRDATRSAEDDTRGTFCKNISDLEVPMPGERAVRPEDVALPSDEAALSEIRHELRTYLNHIVGYGELITEDMDTAGWSAGRRKMEDVLVLASSLTDSVSEFVRVLDSGDRGRCAELLNAEIQPGLIRIRRMALQLGTESEGVSPAETTADLKRVASAADSFLEAIDAGLRRQDSNIERVPLRHNRPAAAGATGATEQRHARLLAVDDNVANLGLLKRFCERRGHSVTTARTGEQALDLLANGKFDLVILDVMLPGINGFEVLNRINGSTKLYVPVIILSSLDDSDAVIQGIRHGAVDFLRKPFNGEVLEARIQAQLDVSDRGIGSTEPRNPHGLSKREIEVLAHVALGKSNREVGQDLFIAENTVVRHVANIFAKAGLSNRAEAGVYAVVNGLARI